MTDEEYNLMVDMLNLQDSIEKLKHILEAEYSRQKGKEMFALQDK